MVLPNTHVLLLLSGEICAGKSSVCTELTNRFGFTSVSTGGYLQKIALEKKLIADRITLQKLGDSLDKETNGEWLIHAYEQSKNPQQRRYFLDSVRKRFQVEIFRNKIDDLVFHLHLSAPDGLLRERFEKRKDSLSHDASISYEDAKKSATEINVKNLSEIADLNIDTSIYSPKDIAFKVMKSID